MALTLGQIASKKLPAAIEFEGGSVMHVEYYSQRISPKIVAIFAAMNEPLVGPDGGGPTVAQVSERVNKVVDILLPLLASWDLVEWVNEETGEIGPVQPIDYDHLSGLGVETLGTILGGILNGNRVGK